MPRIESNSFIEKIDDKLGDIGRKLDNNILYQLILIFVTAIYLYQPSLLEVQLIDSIVFDTKISRILFPILLTFLAVKCGFLLFAYTTVRTEFDSSLSRADSKTKKAKKVFAQLNIGELFYDSIKQNESTNQVDSKRSLLRKSYIWLIPFILGINHALAFYTIYASLWIYYSTICIFLISVNILILAIFYLEYFRRSSKPNGKNVFKCIIPACIVIGGILFLVIIDAYPVRGIQFQIYNQSNHPILGSWKLEEQSFVKFDTLFLSDKHFIQRKPNYISEYSTVQDFVSSEAIERSTDSLVPLKYYFIDEINSARTIHQIIDSSLYTFIEINPDSVRAFALNKIIYTDGSIRFEHN